MSTRAKAMIAWSSGKDSAWALHEARRSNEFDIVGAITTVTDKFARVSMHGVREELLMAQLDAAELPIVVVRIPYPCPNEVYEREMTVAMQQAKARGITHVIFGDLFLGDIRAYREAKLKKVGLAPVFPLWLRSTDALARDMIAVRVTDDLRVVVVASPDYLARHPRPAKPQDLHAHNCLRLRFPSGAFLPWRFAVGDCA